MPMSAAPISTNSGMSWARAMRTWYLPFPNSASSVLLFESGTWNPILFMSFTALLFNLPLFGSAILRVLTVPSPDTTPTLAPQRDRWGFCVRRRKLQSAGWSLSLHP